jgi:hypothetical protein
MPICSSHKGGLSFSKPLVLRKLIEVRGKVGVLLCRTDHRGRIDQNALKNRKRVASSPESLLCLG